MRGGEERVDEKGWGHEERRIIGELIQRETDRGGGRRLWSAGDVKSGPGSNDWPKNKKQKAAAAATFAGTSVNMKEREKKKTESVRGKGGDRQKSEAPNHVEPQID